MAFSGSLTEHLKQCLGVGIGEDPSDVMTMGGDGGAGGDDGQDRRYYQQQRRNSVGDQDDDDSDDDSRRSGPAPLVARFGGSSPLPQPMVVPRKAPITGTTATN